MLDQELERKLKKCWRNITFDVDAEPPKRKKIKERTLFGKCDTETMWPPDDSVWEEIAKVSR